MTVVTGAGDGLLGNHPGYILTCHALLPDGTVGPATGPALNSDLYEAQVKLTLSGGLTGSSATVTLYGLTDADHQALAARRRADGKLALQVIRVHLFWRDSSSKLITSVANLTGLSSITSGLGGLNDQALAKVRVGEYLVSQVTRRRGDRWYETELVGSDALSAALGKALPAAVIDKSLASAPGTLLRPTRLPYVVYPVLPADPAVDPDEVPFAAARGERVAEALQRWARSVELLANRHGRGAVLVRDGTLRLGIRPIPLAGEPLPLTWTTGLLDVEAAGDLTGAAPGAAADDEPTMSPARRRQWRLSLRGRPDLKPGDVVRFDPPDEDAPTRPGLTAAALGAFAAPLGGVAAAEPAGLGYVSSVSHTLSRTAGLLTVITVVELAPGEDGWDRRRRPLSAAEAKSGKDDQEGAASADAPTRLAAELERAIDRRVRQLELAEVGEVRAHRSASGGPRAAAHRSRIWQGTSPAQDGAGHAAVRLPIEAVAPLERTEVPYLTPFAWGRSGLVLPRYPGMRVASIGRHGQPDDDLDAGAVWPDGAGPDSRPGDWWLSLPAAVPAADRESVPGSAEPGPYTGAVSNDLTDADGGRVVEVATLAIRLGALRTAGERPEPAASSLFLLIEHSDGTTVIQITDQGNIKITAGGKLELSGKGVSIDAQGDDVSISARNVAVSVSQEMTVD